MASIELGQPDGAQPSGAQPDIPSGEETPDTVVVGVDSSTIPVKNPNTTLRLKFDWSSQIPDGVTLSIASYQVPEVLAKVDGTVNAGDSTSYLDITGGVHAAMYTLVIAGTRSDGQVITRRWPLRLFNG